MQNRRQEKIAKENDGYANSPQHFFIFGRFEWVFSELSAGFAVSSLYGLLSPTGC